MDDSLKHVPLCEELVAITDDIKEALVLRQMLFWVPRMRDTDAYIKEERSRLEGDPDDAVSLSHGWVYKTGEEVANETMIGSGKTGRRRLSKLVEKGYLNERERQNSNWDRTREYRPNVEAIQEDLKSEGYELQTVVGKDWPVFESLFRSSLPNRQVDDSTQQNDDSTDQGGDSAPAHYAPVRSETTPKNTAESSAPAREEDPDSDEVGEMYDTLMQAARDELHAVKARHGRGLQKVAKTTAGKYAPETVAAALRDDLGGAGGWGPDVFLDSVLPEWVREQNQNPTEPTYEKSREII